MVHIKRLFEQQSTTGKKVSIVGDPGKGKTELAKQFSESEKDAYHHMVWINGSSWQKDYVHLALKYNLISQEESLSFLDQKKEKLSVDHLVHKVHSVLEERNLFRRKSLLIFDNVPNDFFETHLNGVIPDHVDVLMISRNNRSEFCLDLARQDGSLTPEEEIDILKQGNEVKFDEVASKEIIKKFKNMPVAIAQAANYIRNTSCSMEEYLKEFNKNKEEISKDSELTSHLGEKIDLFTSVSLAVQSFLEQKNIEADEALELLTLCAYLPSDKIPMQLLEKFTKNKADLNRRCKSLGTLITRDDQVISMHALFQDFVQIIIEKGKIGYCRDTILSKIGKHVLDYTDFLTQDPNKAEVIYSQAIEDEKRAVYGCLAPIYNALYRINLLSKGYDSSKLSLLYTLCGINYLNLGNYKTALEDFDMAYFLRKNLFGEKHPDVASSLHNIGIPLGNLERHDEALKYEQEALALRKELLGEKHPDVASSLYNIGITLRNLGRHDEALKYKEKALALRKELLGEKHPDVASSLYTIGITLGELRRHDEALKYEQEALALRKELLGEKHPLVASSLYNIGITLGNLGRHDEALKYEQEALALRKELLGEKHPDVASSLYSIGITLGELRRHDEALKYKEKALALRKELLGEKHPDVASSLHNIGITLGNLGRHNEALKYEQEALALRKELLGEKHPDVASSLHNIGITLGNLGRHNEALKYKNEALALRKV